MCDLDRLKRKDFGVFYTPIPYCNKASELVREAIKRVPKGKDYIILDRCAGTGNLESVLSDEELSHCVLSTYEYNEYKELVKRLSHKVRAIIPFIQEYKDYIEGCVRNTDALSKEFIDNEYIRQYVKNPNCTIILYENPPYRDSAATDKTVWENNKSYVFEEMKKHLSEFENKNISTARDIANQFIWSGFKYYLRQTTDSYILFSPIKYWKFLGLANYKFNNGFAFNCKHFGATDSVTSCIFWENIPENREKINLEVFGIVDDTCVKIKDLEVCKAHYTFERYFDRRKFSDDVECGVFCNGDGTEARDRKCLGKSFYNENIIAFSHTNGFSLASQNRIFTRMPLYDNRGTVIRSDNYLEKLPLFVAKFYPKEKWYDIGVYATTSDGEDAYTKDKDFLKYCFIYTCLSTKNKCLSFKGSDGRMYQNELCFDEGSVALRDLQTMVLNEDEKELFELWKKILFEAKKTKNYNSNLRYGVYQIKNDLNTYTEKKKIKVYDYIELNSYLNTLKIKLKDYYKVYIKHLMIKYELVK